MELGEPYDVNKLRNTVEYLIGNEEKNIVVNLGDIEYVSDEAIETFKKLQKKIHKSKGNFGILAPKDKARAILETDFPVFQSSEELADGEKIIGEETRELLIEDDELEEFFPEEESSANSHNSKATKDPEDPSLISMEETSDQTASKKDSEDLEEAVESNKGSDSNEESGAKSRKGADQRRTSPSTRKKSKTRMVRAARGPQNVENTGVVFVDDTVSGTKIDKDEFEARDQKVYAAQGLVDKPRSSAGLIIAIIIIALIGGGVYFFSDGKLPFLSKDDEPTIEPPKAVTPPPDTGTKVEPIQEKKPEKKTKVAKKKKPKTKPKAKSKTKPKTIAKKPKKKPKVVTPPKEEEKVVKPSKPTKFRLITKPSGVTVKLNSKRVGVTPLTITLKDQSSKLSLEKKGYESVSTNLDKGEVGKTLSISLNKIEEKEDDISFGDIEPVSKVKKTPEKKPPPPIKEVKKEEPKKDPPPANTGELTRVFIASKPPGADIFVDGQKIGIRTPKFVNISVGSHKIVVTKGELKAERSVKLIKGKNKSQFFMLK